MFYVYLLRSRKDLKFYIGSTNDLRKRFKDHFEGRVFSTRSRRPLDLIYYEAYTVESNARKREQSLKYRGRARAQLLKRVMDGQV